jgi:hypothetical protein
MKKEFRPVYKVEELLVMDKEFLAKVICRQERDIHNLHEEIRSIMKEWKATINLLNK